ncbi:CD209 antigen-like protein D [Carassius carassius]|uniref:CD209 antigen-like protein D n=1 Tax=Carassius carassius TaxID=217509 RepID=UPI002868BEEC|nr:CD209 antigen-like protein D [Carassius carassius]
MDIYANADAVYIHNVRTEIENTRRHQTPQQTGNETHFIIKPYTYLSHTFELYEFMKHLSSGGDCVKIRRYRAGLVCFVLLCVLLLTGVILLCVHIHIKNTNHTEEKDQLLTKITHLTKERDGLLSSTCDRINLFSDGWINYHNCSLYFISSLKKTWTESRRFCTERGADLIIINNREEQDFVEKISPNYVVWIGLTDSEVEGTWKWVDGSTLNPSFSFWNSQEPDGQRKENCARNFSPGWADYSCSDLGQWICEKGSLK